MTLRLNIFSPEHKYEDEDDCYLIVIIDSFIDEALPVINSNNPLETCLSQDRYHEYNITGTIGEINTVLNSSVIPWRPRVEPLPPLSQEKQLPSVEKPPILELK